MLRTFLLPLLLIVATVQVYSPVKQPSVLLPTNEVSMLSKNIAIKEVRLIARDQRKLLIGQPPTPNRAIGFATVFLTIENAKEEPDSLVIEQIQIEDAKSNHVQLKNQMRQQIHLKPLENSVNDFHLTNKVGYSTYNCVKAVVFHQIDNQMYTIESDPVEVEHY